MERSEREGFGSPLILEDLEGTLVDVFRLWDGLSWYPNSIPGNGTMCDQILLTS